MIKISNLSKKYGSVTIFKSLNLEINTGEIISIVGPSGSGKSTLLNILSGLDRDFSGEISIDNNIVKDIKSDEAMTQFRGKNISFIFQNFNLIDNLTVEENIDLVIHINKLERNYSTQDILSLVGLKDKVDQYPFHLSGGEKQRVAIARAFVGKNTLLLADEPTGSLDRENTKNIIGLIKKLNKKTKNTIVMITHDQEVANIGDAIYELTDYTLIQKHD
ncbi:MAG: ABC transporter ATP-binding protein [Candidatus Gracilibacteria bacterium]|nr:ABC transporter ATP-binding protein [Candidatus Gracilibacteria bacterium]